MAATTEPDALVETERLRLPYRLRQIQWTTWRAAFVRAGRGFLAHNCPDWAAALTYYGVLALFPSAIVIVALVGLVSDGEETVDTVTGLARDVGAGSVVASDGFTEVIRSVVLQQSSASALLSFGLLAALWSASNYIGSFTRASNAIYGVEEGRPFYRLRPLQIGLSAVVLVLLAAVAALLVLSGPVAEVVGDVLNLGTAPRTAWAVVKWPMLVAIMMLLLSLLFWVAPNVRQPRFRWLTVGGLVALVIWALASTGFGLYVSSFGSYDVTYGSIGAVIAFLVWLFLTNCALMFGVEINAALQRGRALQGGADEPVEPALPPKARADT